MDILHSTSRKKENLKALIYYFTEKSLKIYPSGNVSEPTLKWFAVCANPLELAIKLASKFLEDIKNGL